MSVSLVGECLRRLGGTIKKAAGFRAAQMCRNEAREGAQRLTEPNGVRAAYWRRTYTDLLCAVRPYSIVFNNRLVYCLFQSTRMKRDSTLTVGV
jgi:hypothetical protein